MGVQPLVDHGDDLLNLGVGGDELDLGLRCRGGWCSKHLVFWINLSEYEVDITNQAFAEELTDDGVSFTLGINSEGDDRDTREGATTEAGSVLREADLAGGAGWTNHAARGSAAHGDRACGAACGDLSQSGDSGGTDSSHLKEAWLLDEETLAAGVLADFGLSVMNLRDSSDLVGGLSDLLGFLNDLLGLFGDLLLFSADHLLKVLDLLLQSLSSPVSCLLGSLPDFLGHFCAGLRSERSLNILGFLLDSRGLLFDSAYLLGQLCDLGGDDGLVILSFCLLVGFGLDDGLFSLDGAFESSNFLLNLSLLGLILNDNLLFSKFLDLLLTLRDNLGGALDLLLRLDLGNSVSGLLSLELSGLTLNSLPGLGDGVPVSQSILFNLNNSVLVGVSVVSSADSVDGGSLSLSGDLLGVGGLSSDPDVGGVVGGPGRGDGLESRLDRGDLARVSLDDLFVSGNFSLDTGDFSLDARPLFRRDFGEPGGKDFQSGPQVGQLRDCSNLEGLLLAQLLGPSGSFFLVSDLLIAIFLLGSLLNLDLLLINLFLVDNVGGLDTFLDVSDGFLLSILGFLNSGLNFARDLSYHNLRFVDLFLRGDLLLSRGLDDVFGRRDLASDNIQFASERLNI